jgi:hypothetical protein
MADRQLVRTVEKWYRTITRPLYSVRVVEPIVDASGTDHDQLASNEKIGEHCCCCCCCLGCCCDDVGIGAIDVDRVEPEQSGDGSAREASAAQDAHASGDAGDRRQRVRSRIERVVRHDDERHGRQSATTVDVDDIGDISDDDDQRCVVRAEAAERVAVSAAAAAARRERPSATAAATAVDQRHVVDSDNDYETNVADNSATSTAAAAICSAATVSSGVVTECSCLYFCSWCCVVVVAVSIVADCSSSVDIGDARVDDDQCEATAARAAAAVARDALATTRHADAATAASGTCRCKFV